MNMSEIMQPKWFLSTKRGVGMAMAGMATLLPLATAYFGITIDAATWGQFSAEVMKWFEITWNVIAYGLWFVGSVWPTAPLSLKRPV